MPRKKTAINIGMIDHEDERSVFAFVEEVPDLDAALKWVRESGAECVEYVFIRIVKRVTKTIKRTAVLQDG